MTAEDNGPTKRKSEMQGRGRDAGGDEPVRRTARSAPEEFQRHLPHYEGGGNALYITFSTKGRMRLPEEVRGVVLNHVLHDHMRKMDLVCAVVMPDHVHMLYYPWEDEAGNRYTKTEIVGDVKRASAHSVNRLLGRRGALWQDESFDHVLRNQESAEEKAHYIIDNPVRKGLCQEPDDYPYLWRAWVEGQDKAE